jgi:hypothetical protein
MLKKSKAHVEKHKAHVENLVSLWNHMQSVVSGAFGEILWKDGPAALFGGTQDLRHRSLCEII